MGGGIREPLVKPKEIADDLLEQVDAITGPSAPKQRRNLRELREAHYEKVLLTGHATKPLHLKKTKKRVTSKKKSTGSN